jgi:hypothetical protein
MVDVIVRSLRTIEFDAIFADIFVLIEAMLLISYEVAAFGNLVTCKSGKAVSKKTSMQQWLGLKMVCFTGHLIDRRIFISQ